MRCGLRMPSSSERLAHTIKGSAAAISAEVTRIAAAAIEDSAANQDLSAAMVQLAGLDAAIGELIHHCRDFLRNL